MSGSRIVVSVIVLVCAAVLGGASARAEDRPPLPVEVDALIERDRVVEAHALSARMVAASPDDPIARYYAALTDVGLYRFDDADVHVARGLAVSPDHPRLLGVRALRHLLAGEYDAARAAASYALASDPHNGDAAYVADRVRVIDRARARDQIRVAAIGDADRDPALADGSPEALADRFVAMLFDGDDVTELIRLFDSSLLDQLPEGHRRGARLVRALQQAAAGVRRAAEDDQHRYLGWRVTSSKRIGRHGTRVRISIPVEMTISEAGAQRLVHAETDPEARRAVSEANLVLVAYAPAELRESVAHRLVGAHVALITELDVDVIDHGDQLAIYDVRWEGLSARDVLATIPGDVHGSTGGALLALFGITAAGGGAVAAVLARGGRRRRRPRAG